MGRHRDEQGGGHRQEEDPAAVEEHRVLVGLGQQQRDGDQGDHPGAVEHDPASHRQLRGELARPPQHRERRADEQATGASVRALVGAGVVEARRGDQPHRDEGDHREAQGHQRGAVPALAEQRDEAPDHERPEHVELFLDRQRPEVVERAGPVEPGEVRDAQADGRPVAHVEEGGNRLGPADAELAGVAQRRHGQHDDQHQDHRRQQTPRPAQPEVAEIQLTGALDRRAQDARDEEPAQGEEDADAEQATGNGVRAQVVGNHRGHREGAQTVQRGQVGALVVDRAGHGLLRRGGRAGKGFWSVGRCRTPGRAVEPETRCPSVDGTGPRGDSRVTTGCGAPVARRAPDLDRTRPEGCNGFATLLRPSSRFRPSADVRSRGRRTPAVPRRRTAGSAAPPAAASRRRP